MTIERLKGLTVNEIEPNHSAIRDSPVVDWFTTSYDRVSQRYKVPDGGTCPNIFQVRSNRAILATTREVFELLLGRIDLRIQLVQVSIVELSRDGFVDIRGHRVLPEFCIFLYGIETCDLSRADDNIWSADRIETTISTYNVCPTPRGSQETMSNAPWNP